MALFKRSTLKDKGLTDEQAEYVITEASRLLAANYVSKEEMQEQIEKAVSNAVDETKKNTKFDAKETDDYKALQAEFESYKAKESARRSEDFKGVKDKFFDTVFEKVDMTKSIPEQLNKIKEDFEEYFEADEPKDKKPTFGAPIDGSMPKGKEGKETFASLWGYDKKGN